MCTSAQLLAIARVPARHSAMPLLWRRAPTADLIGVTFIWSSGIRRPELAETRSIWCNSGGPSALQDGSKNCKLWASATADTLQWSVTGYQTFWSYAV